MQMRGADNKEANLLPLRNHVAKMQPPSEDIARCPILLDATPENDIHFFYNKCCLILSSGYIK